MQALGWKWLGRIPYGDALRQQRARREAVIEGSLPETLWMLEHEPVITTGRRQVSTLPDRAYLAQFGIDLFHTERGGLATWHGPGQLVSYAIIDAWGRGLGARGTIQAMENGVIQWLSSLGIESGRRPGFPGVWVGENKICAIGMHFSRGVSMHGIALNLDPDMNGYTHIVPCGITDGGITSVAKLLGRCMPVEEAATALAPHLIERITAPRNTVSETPG